MDKSTYLIDAITYSDVILKAPSSVLDPVIRIQTTSANIPFYTYLHINEFARYYFINDIISIRDDLWELRCHVDVLYTYYSTLTSSLLGLNCVVARNETTYDLKMTDERLAFENGYVVSTIAGSSIFTDATGTGALDQNTIMITTVSG